MSAPSCYVLLQIRPKCQTKNPHANIAERCTQGNPNTQANGYAHPDRVIAFILHGALLKLNILPRKEGLYSAL